MLGRGIRGYPGKIDCLVIDYTGRNDLHHMVDYYRTDDDEREESKRKRQERGETEPAELLQVNTAFPAHASHMLGWRIRLPWFKPWPEEPLTALCLWHPSPEKSLEYRYIYVRHTSDGTMVGGKVRIRQQARPPYRLNAMRGMDDQSVAAWLKEELAAGGLVNHLSRKSPLAHQASNRRTKKDLGNHHQPPSKRTKHLRRSVRPLGQAQVRGTHPSQRHQVKHPPRRNRKIEPTSHRKRNRGTTQEPQHTRRP